MIVTWVLLLMTVDWSGANRNRVARMVAMFLLIMGVPAALAAGITRMMSGYVTRASGSDIAAGPTVLGCGVGVLVGIAVAVNSPEAVALPAMGLLSAGGAFVGSLLSEPSRPLHVAGMVAVVAILAFLVGSC